MKDFSKHITHYFALIGLLLAAVLGFWFFSYDRGFQTAIAVAVSFGYFAWGVIHHLIHRDMYLEIVFEYLLISLIGLTIMLSLIYRT